MIIDHRYNELYKKKQQLAQELQILNKKRGEEPKKKDLKKQIIQAEKKLNEYVKRRENSYPTCPFCSQKVSPSCLMVDGCPRNYHNECWIKVGKEIEKEKEASPFLFAKVERLENEIMAMKSNGKAKNREGKKTFSL